MRLKERFPQTINLTVLTWLANMREHLVLSAGSAVILRINCSIGVIPEKDIRRYNVSFISLKKTRFHQLGGYRKIESNGPKG